MGDWHVTYRVEGKQGALPEGAEVSGDAPVQGLNLGGIIIEVSNGATKQEVGRVAFQREHSKHPDVALEDQVKVVTDKARAAVTLLNEDLSGNGELQ